MKLLINSTVKLVTFYTCMGKKDMEGLQKLLAMPRTLKGMWVTPKDHNS